MAQGEETRRLRTRPSTGEADPDARAPARAADPMVTAFERPRNGDGAPPITNGATLPMIESEPVDTRGVLARGTAVGRYLLLSVLGKGGMGVVYAAYDPELDRRIALKVLRGNDDVGGRVRMQREAQALARLSHPNVIAIHDVGTYEASRTPPAPDELAPRGLEAQGGLFIAMELVDGATLRRWQVDRPWREVVDAYLAAGRGLAAAHAANLVHRDFKPENVLVGTDGRVRVTDFGLVRADLRVPAPEDTAPLGRGGDAITAPDAVAVPAVTPRPASGTPSPLTSELTEAGAVLGTPHYMSPEQLDGRLADERSDQFSYCVALWEALAGSRPFPAEDMAGLSAAIKAGPPRSTARGERAALLRVVGRGLAAEPSLRWPSMAALIHALERAMAIRRRAAVAGILASAALAIAGLVLVGTLRGEAPCSDAGAAADTVWSPDLRGQIQRDFVATGLPFAGDAFAAVDRAVKGWSTQWQAMATESCRATRVSRTQSATMLDLRTACLSGRLAQARGLLASLPGADRALVADAVAVVASLPELGPCADAAGLTARAPRPTDGDAVQRLDALEVALAELAGRGQHTGDPARLRELRDRAERLVVDARGLRWRPAEAAALLVRGDLERRAGDGKAARQSLLSAAAAAAAGDDPAREVEAMTALIDVDTALTSDYGDAEAWALLAEGSLGRIANPGRLAVELGRRRAALAVAQGKLDEARGHVETALALAERTYGSEHDTVVDLLLELADIDDRAGRHADAETHLARALPLAERVYGAAHPTLASLRRELGIVAYHRADYDTAIARFREAIALRERALGTEAVSLAGDLTSLGSALLGAGKTDDAVASYQRALALAERHYGPDHVEVADILGEMGGAYNRRGDHGAARAANLRALAIRERVLGPEHPSVGYSLVNVAIESKALGQMSDVEPRYRRAIAIFEKTLGPRHATTGIAQLNLAELLRVTGRLGDAAVAYEHAGAILSQALGPDHPVLAHVWNGQGQLAVARGRADEAIPLLERAVTRREADAGDAPALAESRLALARALRAAGKDAPRARRLAEQARDAWAVIGGDYADERASAEAFLRRQETTR
jgi:serine/threonine protein kinase/tetratricopeptide (TPR) repeat protein